MGYAGGLFVTNWIIPASNASENTVYSGSGGIFCPGRLAYPSMFAGGGGGIFSTKAVANYEGSAYLHMNEAQSSGGGQMFGFGGGGSTPKSNNLAAASGEDGGCILIYGNLI